MIKTIHTCDIDLYCKIEATGNVSLLREWYNFLPVSLFKKKVDKFFEDYSNIVNINSYSGDLHREKMKIISYNKIQSLELIYIGLFTAFQEKTIKDVLRAFSDANIDSAMKFQWYLSQVEEKTGIKINDVADLKKLTSEIQRMKDKFFEIWGKLKEKPKGKTLTFAQYSDAMFAYMDRPFNGKMSIYQFGEMKKNYEERIKRLDSQKHGINK